MHDPQSDMDMRQKTNIVFMLLACFARPVQMFTAVGGTAGYRLVGSINAAWSFALIALFAGLGRSEALWWWLGVAVFFQAYHRAKSRRTPGVHSYSVGVSHFAKRLGAGRARAAEVLLTLLAAGVLHDAEPAAGLYFLLSALGQAATASFAQMRADAIEDDMSDGLIEMEARSGASPAVRRPWDTRN